MERGTGVNCFGSDTNAIVRAMGGAKDGAESVTAETAPHGPPSQRVIMVAQESNAMPTGPRNSQAVSTAKISQRERPRTIQLMVPRGAVEPFTDNPRVAVAQSWE